MNMHVPLIQPQVGKDSKGQGILQKEPKILYVFLTNFKFDSQNNPTYPLNSAHSFIVYFYEKLFYLFSTLEMKKNKFAYILHRIQLFTRLLWEGIQKEGNLHVSNLWISY